MILPSNGSVFWGWRAGWDGDDLAGAAHLELVSGVVPLRPEDAMTKAMLNGWRAQQKARGLQESTIEPRERLVRAFIEFTNEYPWNWGPGHVEEWTLSLTAERNLAASTIRGYQTDLRLFSEYLCDGRYGWAAECERRFHEHGAAYGAGPGARRAAGLRTGETDDAQAGLPVEPAAGDGQPRHVRSPPTWPGRWPSGASSCRRARSTGWSPSGRSGSA